MTLNIIVAFSHKKFGIGFKNKLPWNIPTDLHYFNRMTKGSVVVMGKNTWFSIPEDKRPLKGRINIVVGREFSCIIDTQRDIDRYLSQGRSVFIIGGSALYKRYMGVADKIYATVVEKEFGSDGNSGYDTFFPVEKFNEYAIESYSTRFFSNEEQCFYRHIVYENTFGVTHGEHCYLRTMIDVIETGELQLDRTRVGTKCLFAPDPLRFDVSKNIPLFTTKYVNFKMIVEELLWFLKGETDADKLAKKGINIWKPNTTREFLDKRGLSHYEENDIGSMYGWIWNHVGADYRGCNADYTGQGINQLHMLIQSLKNDPFSRRHLLTSYCPVYVDQGCLMPCHGIVTQFHVSNKKELSCHVYNRSQDVFLGQPFNVASYSILLYIIAAKCGYKPKELVVSLGNTHVYQTHEEQCKTQLSRVPLPFPVLELSDAVKDKDLKALTIDDFTLVGYLHHAGIKAPMAV